MNVGTSYGAIARTILSTVCTGGGDEVHVCLDKYIKNSIKDSERKLRGAEDSIYTITGADQTMRHKGEKLQEWNVQKQALKMSAEGMGKEPLSEHAKWKNIVHLFW